MKYSPSYFKENMPEWKRKKDPVLSMLFYRPVSFVLASLCARFDVKPNTVSYFSMFVAIVASCLYLTKSRELHIVGALLVNFWLILDCTDGNLARGYKRQMFGEFADGVSSYVLVCLLCTMVGFSVYFDGGFFIDSYCPWIILLGALGSSADTLMRLVYQKYKATEKDMADKGLVVVENDNRKDHSQVKSFRVRIESELGIGGILPLALLLATIFNALDLFIVYCFLYYGTSCIFAIAMFVSKAIKKTNVID